MRTNRAFCCKLAHGLAAAIAHARLQPAHHLVHDHRHRSAIRHAAFDAFRHQACPAGSSRRQRRHLGRGISVGVLEIALARALRHRAQRSHAAIRLEGAALIQDQLARDFRRFRQTSSRSSPRKLRLPAPSLISPEYLMPPSAMMGTPASRVARAASAIAVICGTPDAGHDARGADRARPDADFDAVALRP